MSYQDPSLHDRQKNAMAAKQAMLQKFREKAEDPNLAARQAERKAIHEARVVREAERDRLRKLEEKRLAEEAARKAAEEEKIRLAAEAEAERLKAEEAEVMVSLLAEQKAARDARYAARKAAKKARRKGY